MLDQKGYSVNTSEIYEARDRLIQDGTFKNILK